MIDYAYDVQYSHIGDDFMDVICGNYLNARKNHIDIRCQENLPIIIEKSKLIAEINKITFNDSLLCEIKKYIFRDYYGYGILLKIEIENVINNYNLKQIDEIYGYFIHEAEREINEKTPNGIEYQKWIDEVFELAIEARGRFDKQQ